jgi:hypothetical protein
MVVFADRRGAFVIIKGKQNTLDKVEADVIKILREQKSSHNRAEHCRLSGDIDGLLRLIGNDESVHYPPYWQLDSNTGYEGEPKVRLVDLPAEHPLYLEILTLVLQTFSLEKVGKGFDAVNLQHSKLVVKKISAVQNKFLFQQYCPKKKQLCLQSLVNRPPPIANFDGEHEIMTQYICRSFGNYVHVSFCII